MTQLLSSFAFSFTVRRYTQAVDDAIVASTAAATAWSGLPDTLLLANAF